MTGEQPTKKDNSATQIKINEQKWTPTVWSAGWTAVPSAIIEHQHALGLDAVDLNIIMHLTMYWWRPDNAPYPSKATLARAMNVDPRTVQRRIANLEAIGFIRREERRIKGKGSKTNRYHLDGLVAALKPFAEEKLREREQQRSATEARIKRKRPKLEIVK